MSIFDLFLKSMCFDEHRDIDDLFSEEDLIISCESFNYKAYHCNGWKKQNTPMIYNTGILR